MKSIEATFIALLVGFAVVTEGHAGDYYFYKAHKPKNTVKRSQSDRQKAHRSRPRTNRSRTPKRMQPDLIFRVLSHLLIVFLSVILVVLAEDEGPE
jgi:hypothetical protein